MIKESLYWPDQKAEEIIKKRKRKEYVCASGVSPSGVIHVGKVKEVMVTYLVAQSIIDQGKKAKHIHSWDDYDRFRKVPAEAPKHYENYIGMPLCDIPDPWGCHDSWALHFEKDLEENVKDLNVKIEFQSQAKMYKSCVYADSIKKVMNNKDIVIEVLNKYRKEPLSKEWYPIQVYCERCKKDVTKVVAYDGDYKVKYKCQCGYENEIDFRKVGIVKLRWKADWPMRWAYHKVDFEPGGLDHSTAGSSRDVGAQIVKRIFNEEAPIYQVYYQIKMKGMKKKMSGSEGGKVLDIKGLEKYYIPELIRYFYAKPRPDTDVVLPLDEDLLKFYDEFYRTESSYYEQDVENKKKQNNLTRIYEKSVLEAPSKKQPLQLGFRTAIMLSQIPDAKPILEQLNIKPKTKSDEIRLNNVISCARNWLHDYAPDKYKLVLSDKKISLDKKEKEIFAGIAKVISGKKSDEEMQNDIFEVIKKHEVNSSDLFKKVYQVLIEQERGPKLATLIIALGVDKVKNRIKDLI